MADRPLTPNECDYPELRVLAVDAERVDHLKCAAEEPESPSGGADAVADLRARVLSRLEREDASPSSALERWLGADPEHAPVLGVAIVLPWRATPGYWRDGVPHWAPILATHVAVVPATARPPPHRPANPDWR